MLKVGYEGKFIMTCYRNNLIFSNFCHPNLNIRRIKISLKIKNTKMI